MISRGRPALRGPGVRNDWPVIPRLAAGYAAALRKPTPHRETIAVLEDRNFTHPRYKDCDCEYASAMNLLEFEYPPVGA